MLILGNNLAAVAHICSTKNLNIIFNRIKHRIIPLKFVIIKYLQASLRNLPYV